MHTVLIVAHLMIVIALVIVVLLQRSEGGGLGIGGGGNFMSGRAKANPLSTATAWLAAAFFGTSIVLAIMAGTDRIAPSLIPRSAPAGSTAPGIPTEGGLLDSLKQQQAPAAPQAPISGAPSATAPAAPAPAAPSAPAPSAPAPETAPAPAQ